MNAQDRVLERFPSGQARKERAPFQPGIDCCTQGYWWVVFAGPEFDSEELGRGRTEAEAWSDAAGLLGNQAA
jgi:hypothetical protein